MPHTLCVVGQQQAQYGQDDACGGFREFALALYGADGVSRAALALQDRRGVDVNMLLFAAYVGARGERALTRDDIEAARHRVGPWQDTVVTPLRTVRRTLRSADRPGAAELSARLQEIELAAELAELAELAEMAPAAARIPHTDDTIREALGATVAAYAGTEPDAQDHADIAVLTAGVRR